LYIIILLLSCIVVVAVLRADAPWPRVLTSPPPPPRSWGAAFFPPSAAIARIPLGTPTPMPRAETLARRESLTAADDRRLPRPVTTPRPADAPNRLLTLAGWRNVSPETLFQYFPLCGDVRPRAILAVRRGNHIVGARKSDFTCRSPMKLSLLTLPPTDAASLFFFVGSKGVRLKWFTYLTMSPSSHACLDPREKIKHLNYR